MNEIIGQMKRAAKNCQFGSHLISLCNSIFAVMLLSVDHFRFIRFRFALGHFDARTPTAIQLYHLHFVFYHFDDLFTTLKSTETSASKVHSNKRAGSLQAARGKLHTARKSSSALSLSLSSPSSPSSLCLSLAHALTMPSSHGDKSKQLMKKKNRSWNRQRMASHKKICSSQHHCSTSNVLEAASPSFHEHLFCASCIQPAVPATHVEACFCLRKHARS